MEGNFDNKYYDENYFAIKGGKKFKTSGGNEGEWSYANPEGEWEGCGPVVQAWKEVFHPQNMLDAGCVLPDCEVRIKNGYKMIKDINEGEELENGNVIKKFARNYDDTMIYIKPIFLDGISFTKEHPILVARKTQKLNDQRKPATFEIMGFKKAEDIIFSANYEKCDYVVIPKIKEENDAYLDFIKPDPKHGINLGTQIVDEGWARIIGWYLAEGYSDGRMVGFALGDEPEYAQEIIQLAESKGLKGNINTRSNGKVGMRVRIHSVSLMRTLTNICGRGAKNKHLPEGFLYWKKEILRALIDAYTNGDGHERSNRIGMYGVHSVSKRLIKEVQLALLKIGFPSSYSCSIHPESMIEGRKLRGGRHDYALEWSENEFFKYDDDENYYFKVKEIKEYQYSGVVMNLQTTSETYKVPFVIHNCGRGTFLAYARAIGIEAVGFDFSPWACTHLYTTCQGDWVRCADATQKWDYPDKSFDLVTVLDLMEHLYLPDIDKVIEEIYRVAKKYVFLQIATVGSDVNHNKYALKKGEPVPVELEGLAVAGHVTVQDRAFWVEKLKRDGWVLRDDLVLEFIRLCPCNVISNWLKNTIIVLERV